MAISSAPDHRWEQLRPGIWWGTYGDDHIGVIIESGPRFRTRDADDVWLGDYPTLGIAQAILTRPVLIGWRATDGTLCTLAGT